MVSDSFIKILTCRFYSGNYLQTEGAGQTKRMCVCGGDDSIVTLRSAPYLQLHYNPASLFLALNISI